MRQEPVAARGLSEAMGRRSRGYPSVRGRRPQPLAAIRRTAPGTALILYSGGMTAELAAEDRDFDVRVVLEKPVFAEQLVLAVRAALAAS